MTTTLDDVMAELAALEDPRMRAVNERHSDDHGVNLTRLRAVARMADTPDRLQWAMNECLVQIGITTPQLRARAIAIGESLRVLEDYPTSPGCTSPYAPVWIAEMVRRQEA